MPSGAAFIFHGDDLFERNLPSALPQGAHSINGSLNPLPVNLNLRDKSSHTLAVASDDNALSPLHVVEDAEEMSLGFGCLDSLHKMTSQTDWL
jgi:hypothetical protein